MSTYATLLTKAQTALEQVLAGGVATYSLGGPNGSQTVTRLDIEKLERHIEWLERKVAEEGDTPLTQSLSFGGTQA